LKRLLPIRLSGVTVHVHWSVPVVAGLLVFCAPESGGAMLFVAAAYVGLLLLHEWGHLVAARRCGCTVWSIELYPLHGFTRFSAPRSHYDTCVIAWGGVLAQAAAAVPLILFASVFGFTSIGPLNMVIALFGYLSAVIAAFNLLPVHRLDGATAWQILPYLWHRRRPSRRPIGHPPGRALARSRKGKVEEGPWLH
jgi:Zn-dependent protease